MQDNYNHFLYLYLFILINNNKEEINSKKQSVKLSVYFKITNLSANILVIYITH